MSLHRDYILRLVQQVTEAIAQVAGLKKENRPDEGLRIIGDTTKELFGTDPKILELMDTESLGSLLSNSYKLKALATLYKEAATCYVDMGHRESAISTQRRALDLFQMAKTHLSEPDEEIDQAIEELTGKPG